MKINPAAAYDQYQTRVNGTKNGPAAGAKGAGKAARADKVTLSGEAAQRAEQSRLASALAGEVESAASPERLAALHDAVQAGEYHVSSEDIADAMLDMKV